MPLLSIYVVLGQNHIMMVRFSKKRMREDVGQNTYENIFERIGKEIKDVLETESVLQRKPYYG
jgi:hypothetical protein